MFYLIFAIFVRILSNSYINVFQKLLTQRGEYSAIINFYTYLGLTIIGLIICPKPLFDVNILPFIITMGTLGSLGNFFIIKALSSGELSSVAPINSYKPIIALIFGMILLNEYPQFLDLIGIGLILFGTLLLAKAKIFYTKATLYRFIALVLLGIEAIFIKKVILLTDINSTFFYWVMIGLIFSAFFAITIKQPLKIKKENLKFQMLLVILVALMQYTTNYIFLKMNVAYALALFQLSAILSVFLGVNIFKESGFLKKIIASIIMLIGAVIIILF